MKLKKSQLIEKSKVVEALRGASEEVTAAIESFNWAMVTEWEKVEGAIAKYNSAASDAREFQSGIASDARDYYNDKTEKWQEGEKGQAVASFADAWEQEIEELEIHCPEEIDAPDFDAIDSLENLPDEPEA